MLSSLPPIATSIDAFLDSKIQFLESKKHYLQIYNHEIRGLQRVGETDNVDLKDEIIKTTEEEFSTARESLILKRGRRPIKEDMADEVENGPDLQVAFRAAMVDRVRLCTSQQKPVEFDKKKFRKEVDDYHSGDEDFGAWCHLTGWQSKIMIKAAHLVPKSLDRETCRRLFGGDVDPATDVRNSLLLLRGLEARLDKGDIVIVPTVDEKNEWRCIVTRPEKNTELVDRNTTLKDLDGRRLSFRSHNRPAKRYLFFRFLMTFLLRKKEGCTDWAKDIETSLEGWVTSGGYLRESTLVSLAEYYCGEENSAEFLRLCANIMFSDQEAPSPEVEIELRAEKTLLNLKSILLQYSHLANDESDEEDSDTDYEVSP